MSFIYNNVRYVITLLILYLSAEVFYVLFYEGIQSLHPDKVFRIEVPVFKMSLFIGHTHAAEDVTLLLFVQLGVSVLVFVGFRFWQAVLIL